MFSFIFAATQIGGTIGGLGWLAGKVASAVAWVAGRYKAGPKDARFRDKALSVVRTPAKATPSAVSTKTPQEASAVIEMMGLPPEELLILGQKAIKEAKTAAAA